MQLRDAATQVDAAFERAMIRPTAQRRLVMEHLLVKPEHPTVDSLCLALNHKRANISRATVYNTLHALVEVGLVREFTLEGSAARYEANLDAHHHFLCDKCGGIDDIEWFDVPEAQDAGQHSVRAYEVIVRGVCARCRAQNPVARGTKKLTQQIQEK